MESSAPSTRDSQVAMLPSPDGGRKSPRRAFTILGVILGAVLIAIGIFLFATRNQVTTDDAEIEADVEPIAPRVGGPIVKIDVQDNQRVKAGQLLVEIDPSDYDAREKQAEAQLALAQAQAQGAEAGLQITQAQATGGLTTAQAALSGSSVGVISAKAQVDAARAALARAEAEAHRAQLDLKRTKQLFADQAVPQERMDSAQIAADAASAQVAQARAQLAAADEFERGARSRVTEAEGRLGVAKPIEAQIDAAKAKASAAEAQVKAAEAALALAKLQLGYTKVAAPIDGMVSKLRLQPGELLSPGQPIAELVPDQVYVEANFKETQIGDMKAGQRAEISVDAFPGRTLHGTVESLSGGTGARFSLLPPDNASGNFVKVVQRIPVRIKLEEMPKELRLAAGLSADVTVYSN
ncbi:MAG: HlyD family secretion protein [Deltaproteobacteria bacterium]